MEGRPDCGEGLIVGADDLDLALPFGDRRVPPG
jgi:hypothetical protein